LEAEPVNFWLLGTIGLVSIIGLWMYGDELVPIGEALYSIPPTNAWDRIEVNSNVTYVERGDNYTEAISYSDTLKLVSDGSINITIGRIP